MKHYDVAAQVRLNWIYWIIQLMVLGLCLYFFITEKGNLRGYSLIVAVIWAMVNAMIAQWRR